MLGWEIFISRLPPGNSVDEAVFLAQHGDELRKMAPDKRKPWEEALLAKWMTSGDLDWLTKLEKENKAELLLGNGYPLFCTSAAKHILPIISSGPPPHDSPPVIGDDYIFPRGWIGNVTIHHDRISQCHPDEVLTIEAWDQS